MAATTRYIQLAWQQREADPRQWEIDQRLYQEIPEFDGYNASAWICKANKFFYYHETPTYMRVYLASFHMKGEALVWFKNASKARGSWEEFLKALQTRFSQEWQQQQENQQKEYKLYQERQQKLQEEYQEACRRTQEANQGFLKACDNVLEILQELAQEEERNEQLKKAEEKIQEQEQNTFETAESSNPLGGIDDQTAENIGDFNPNDVHNDEFLDLSREIESMEFKNVLLISEKVEIKEEIKKLKMEQEFVKFFSDGDGLYCNAEKVFDRKLKRQWVAGVFHLWGGGWCFDPRKKLIFLEEIPSYLNQHNDCKAGASDLSKNLESMELEKLQLKDVCKENEICQGQFCFFDARPMGFVSEQRSWILWCFDPGVLRLQNGLILAIMASWKLTHNGFDNSKTMHMKLLKFWMGLRHRWRWKIAVKGNGEEKYVEDEGTGRCAKVAGQKYVRSGRIMFKRLRRSFGN